MPLAVNKNLLEIEATAFFDLYGDDAQDILGDVTTSAVGCQTDASFQNTAVTAATDPLELMVVASTACNAELDARGTLLMTKMRAVILDMKFAFPIEYPNADVVENDGKGSCFGVVPPFPVLEAALEEELKDNIEDDDKEKHELGNGCLSGLPEVLHELGDLLGIDFQPPDFPGLPDPRGCLRVLRVRYETLAEQAYLQHGVISDWRWFCEYVEQDADE